MGVKKGEARLDPKKYQRESKMKQTMITELED